MFISVPYVYPSESNSQTMRNKGTAIALFVNWLMVYVVVLITPDCKFLYAEVRVSRADQSTYQALKLSGGATSSSLPP